MTINVNDAYLKQIASGSTNVFNYDFFVAKQSDLLVFVDGSPTATTAITGLENPTGGTFTISGNPTTGAEVVAARGLDIERKTNFTTNGDLTAELINKEFNYVNELIEQSEVRNNRSIKFDDVVDLTATTIFLAQPIANASLRTNAAGDTIEFIDDDSNPFNITIQAKVDEAEGFADDSAASATASASSAVGSGVFSTNSSGFANDAFSSSLAASGFADDAAAEVVLAADEKTLASEHASNPEDVPIPVVGGFSALHYAAKAQAALNQTFESGGVFDPTAGPEYPDVSNVEVDTIWIIEKAHTYVAGDLIGESASAGDQLFFDTPGDVFFLIKVVGGGVQSVNGDVGPVVTITAAGLGAALETITVNGQALTSNVTITAATLNVVPTSTTVNGQALTDDVLITLTTLGYTGATDANKYVHSLNATTNVNTANAVVIDQISTDSEGHITVLSTRTMTAANLGAVPTSRTVNNKALTANITLNRTDVVCLGYATGGVLTSGTAAPTGGANGDVYIQFT